MTKQELLDRTIERLTKYGWIQHEFSNETGSCMLGAITTAWVTQSDCSNTPYNNLRKDLKNLLIKKYPEHTVDPDGDWLTNKKPYGLDIIAYYNDDIAKTKEEVLAVLNELKASYNE